MLLLNSDTKHMKIMTIPPHTTQGGSKHDGIASVLRIRHGITTTQNHIKEDLIDFVARRTGKRIIASFFNSLWYTQRVFLIL